MAHVWTLKTVRDRCKDDGGCWIWQQSTIRGYPQASINGHSGTMVRRWVWLSTHSKEPNGLWRVLSTCEDRRCCNPDHLIAVRPSRVTQKGWRDGGRDRQLLRSLQRGRLIAAGLVKLTAEQASAIRADPRQAKEVAAEYGVTVGHIYAIRSWRVWKGTTRVTSIFDLGAQGIS